MRTLMLGFVAAAGLAVAVPAVAQDVYVGGRGVGVEFDSGRHRDHDWRSDRYRTDGFARHERFERCSTTIIRRGDGSVRKIKRCRD
jgi:hypothetical protein